MPELKVPVAFCQLDGTVAGGAPATFVTEPVVMRMGAHTETLSFIVTPGMEGPLILGMAWLLKWKPYVNWRKQILKFRQQNSEETPRGALVNPTSPIPLKEELGRAK